MSGSKVRGGCMFFLKFGGVGFSNGPITLKLQDFYFQKFNAVFITSCLFFSKIFKNNNPVTSKLSPIDSKLNFTYKMFLK